MTRQPHDPISRRQLLTAAAAIAVAAPAATASAEADAPLLKGNIRQSVCHWCYGKLSLEDMCIGAVKAGCKGIDLVKPSDWPTLKKYNLVGTMTPSHSIEKGLNRKENWESCLGSIRDGIEKSAEAGYPNVICFSGNRGGMDDEEGIRIVPSAEAGRRLGRAEESHHLHGTAQQQGEPQGLHVRSHRMGCEARQGRRK